jgi:hypothetical protein
MTPASDMEDWRGSQIFHELAKALVVLIQGVPTS